ncbi:MAG TPA: sigma-54 dependent transcriptional regulator [Longimicrobium sp.]|nr:sigma-54 dependent transcriptional regulator [Longimicrobium sp.]
MRLLIVDDDAEIRRSLGQGLEETGHQVRVENDPERALQRAASGGFDLILCNVRLPGTDGVGFLRRYRAGGGSALLIMLSPSGSEEGAIAAMREGAYDWVQKPFRAEEVAFAIRKAEELLRLRREVETLRSTVGSGSVNDLVVCESRVMRDIVDMANRVARHQTAVLLTGEPGTGKEVLARAIHRMSPRSERGFTAINCAAIPGQLLESELFGHVAGAMPGATADHAGLFEAAHQGTLLVDEIGALPPELQARMMRVLQEGRVARTGGREGHEVDVRVIAASSKALEDAVAGGEFRSDLYHHLNAVRIHLPPLRERLEDIPALLTHFAGQAAHRLGHPVSVTPSALAALSQYSWPGNVRELRNAVDRAAALAGDGRLDVKDFVMLVRNGNGNGHANGAANGAPAGLDLKSQVEAVERQAILRALEASGGNRRQAASLLGISLRTLFYKMRRLPVH